MIALLLSLAFADCPENAIIKYGKIETQDKIYKVSGARNRAALEIVLSKCENGFIAQHKFDEWNRQRRLTYITAATGFILWPLWIATPVHAVKAGNNKRALAATLEMEG